MSQTTIPIPLTHHAMSRMTGRRIHPESVMATLEFGREVRARGAEIFVLGRRDVARAKRSGVDLSELEGLQVVCAPNGGPVMTCYRNRDVSRIRDRRSRFARRYGWRASTQWLVPDDDRTLEAA